MDKIPEEQKRNVCFAGDLIDRGPGSRQVVQYVIDNGFDCVRGNHEQMMIDWSGHYTDMLWLGNGGQECLNSYKETDDNEYLKGPIDKELFEKHRKWMGNLPVYLEYKGVLTPDGRHLIVSICHNQYKHLESDDEHKKTSAVNQIMWGRVFHSIKDAGFFNVIGHTPDERNPQIKTIYANIDTGAFIGYGGWTKYKKGGLGYLTALHVPTMTIYKQECIDK